MLNFKYSLVVGFFFSLALLTSCASTQQELEAKYAQAPSQFVEIDGTRIHYRDEGEGPTIVLIHGVLASLHTWDQWAAELKKDHRVIRFDVPAFGLTGKMGNENYELDNYMIVIEKFLKKVNAPQKFTIVGNSLGGLLGWNYALLHPDQVVKLALIDAGAYPQELPSILKLLINPIVRNIPVALWPKFLIEQNLKTVYGDSEKILPEKVQLYYDINSYPGVHEASVKLFQNLEKLSKTEPVGLVKLGQLNIPVMIMWGEKDIWVPFNPRWKEDLPRAHYVFYPGVGHIPMEEIPEVSLNDFKSWYTKID